MDAVPASTLRAARDIIAHDAAQGRINMSYSLEVRDEAGESVHILDFTDAVEIVRAK